jgi:hypothetical protein
MVEQTNRQLLKASVAVAPLGSLAAILPATQSKAEAPLAAPGYGAKDARLNASDVQVLFADLQVALVAGSRTMEAKASAQSAGVLAKVAALLALPTLFSVVPEGGGPPNLIPELVPYAKPANTIPRTLADPFMDDATAAALAAANRKTLVIAGFSAEGRSCKPSLAASSPATACNTWSTPSAATGIAPRRRPFATWDAPAPFRRPSSA